MDILIDNKNIKTVYDIEILDYTGALGFAPERPDSRTWHDKSGIEKLLANPRYDTREFVLNCIVKADNEVQAAEKANVLASYLFDKGLVVLSLRDDAKAIRECFLVERSAAIIPTINIRQQNSLYVFKLGMRDVNPNAIKYKTDIVAGEATINYTKGQNGYLFWGNGDRENVSNSGDYTKSDYAADGKVDIIIDVDKTEDDVVSLAAIFSADITSGVKQQDVEFTDASTGAPVLWSWNFGDGTTSDEQSPIHTYEEAGTYTVTLQIFNDASGSDVETKVDYITIRNARLKINGADFLLKNATDKILKN